MLLSIALGNVRRSVRDYSVYFATLCFAACLLYSFVASSDYLLGLDLSAAQRRAYQSGAGVWEAFSLFIVIVFIFLVGYANRFIVRRRKREFALYALLGMGRVRVSVILALEGAIVGAGALGAGLIVGALLSPVFAAIAAFVLDAPWRFVLSFSPAAAIWTTGCFAAITALGAAACAREVRRRPLVELMCAERAPDRLRTSSRLSSWAQLIVGLALLAVVWGTCLRNPVYFMVFVIPMGLMAFVATWLVLRFLAARAPELWRRRTQRYWSGLTPFTVRQIEARISSTAAALACVCVLIAAAVCMTCIGFLFSIGMRGGDVAIEKGAVLAPLGYIGMFYGLTFLIAAAAILALQQLSGASDARASYERLRTLGAGRDLVRQALRRQIRVYFAVPVIFAFVHDLFGLMLIFFLTVALGSDAMLPIFGAVLALTLALMALYYRITCCICERMLLAEVRSEDDGAASRVR